MNLIPSLNAEETKKKIESIILNINGAIKLQNRYHGTFKKEGKINSPESNVPLL